MFGHVGLGTFPFANPFTPMGDMDIKAVLDKYFALGGRYIDTAPTYAFGRVEELMGQYFSQLDRSKFAVSTSCGYVRDGDGFRVSGRPDDIRRDFDESLIRLSLDYIDIYISHIPDQLTPKKDTAAALCRLRDEGVVRQVGVSNVSADDLRHYLEGGKIDIVQNRLSFLNRELDEQLVSICRENGIKIVAYQALERGVLADRGLVDFESRTVDLRHRKPEFQPDRLSVLRKLVEDHLAPIARSSGTTVESLAVRWCLAQPGVDLVQVGATSPAQVERFPIPYQPLSDDLLASLEDAYLAISRHVREAGSQTVRSFMGLDTYDVSQGSASGK